MDGPPAADTDEAHARRSAAHVTGPPEPALSQSAPSAAAPPAPASSLPHAPPVAARLATRTPTIPERLACLVDALVGPEEAWVRDRWMHTRHARASASARGLATIGAACHRRCRSLVSDLCLFSIALRPDLRLAVGGVMDAFCRFSHRLLRAWEAELRMGAEDASALLGPAIERAWVLAAPDLAPLAPLVSALFRGHMLQSFVPAYLEYTLAEDRRLPPPASLGLPLPLGDALPLPLPPLPAGPMHADAPRPDRETAVAEEVDDDEDDEHDGPSS